MCALNGKLYIVGGSDPYGQKGLKNCDVFDPITKSWTSCAPLNIRKLIFFLSLFSLRLSQRYVQCTLTVLGGTVIVLVWLDLIGRHQSAVCELGGYLYIIGGAESWNCLNTVERYNPENNTWTLIASMNVARRGAGVAVLDGECWDLESWGMGSGKSLF